MKQSNIYLAAIVSESRPIWIQVGNVFNSSSTGNINLSSIEEISKVLLDLYSEIFLVNRLFVYSH